MTYVTVLVLATPAAAKLWKPDDAEPRVIVPDPVVAVVIFARLTKVAIFTLHFHILNTHETIVAPSVEVVTQFGSW